MQVFTTPKTIRASKEILKKAKQILKKYPEDYHNFSDVTRAAIITLHRIKFGQKKVVINDIRNGKL